MLSKLVSTGNLKIGKDTLIFNMGSYTNCASRKKGLCKLGNKCYAWKAERQYTNPIRNCLSHRNNQEKYWLENSKEKIYLDFDNLLIKKRNPIKYIRFNEAGDFHSQECVEKLKYLAKHLPSVIFYTYTHRKDLSFKKLPSNLIITTSNFKRKNMNSFYVVEKFNKNNLQCKLNCRICNFCKVNHGKTIEIFMH